MRNHKNKKINFLKMIQKQRQGITKEGIPLSSTSTLKEPLSQSQERTNQQQSNHKNQSRINYKASKSVEIIISADQSNFILVFNYFKNVNKRKYHL